MRTLLKVTPDVQAANRAIVDGTFGEIVEATIAAIHPESIFFLADKGRRTACFIFDLKSSSDIPRIAEPFFTKLNAELSFTPAMNYEELKKGLLLWKESAMK